MIIVKLQGGMGNQMFQYAIAKALSLKYNTNFYLYREHLDKLDWRNYDLDLFNIDNNTIDNKWISDNHITINKSVNEDWGDFKFEHNIYNCLENSDQVAYLNGYFQNIGYFEEFDDIIKTQFTLKNEISNSRSLNLLSDIRNSESVMLNVRRTDFVNNSYHGTMDLDYYNQAIDILNSKYDNLKYFIFSDDIDWCKENLKIENSFIVDHSYKGDRFGEYLELMKNCKHYIIPNSSFAWWSAYLSYNLDNKVVITPKKWFTNDTIDIVSDKLNWIKI